MNFPILRREEGAGKLYWDGVLKILGWGAEKFGWVGVMEWKKGIYMVAVLCETM